jgi:hypothetical protein
VNHGAALAERPTDAARGQVSGIAAGSTFDLVLITRHRASHRAHPNLGRAQDLRCMVGNPLDRRGKLGPQSHRWPPIKVTMPAHQRQPSFARSAQLEGHLPLRVG